MEKKKGSTNETNSRCKNLTKKDNNSKYFHAMTSKNMKQKLIKRLKIGGTWVEQKDEISKAIVEYFKDSFTQKPLPEIELEFGVFKQLSLEIVTQLEMLPTEEEIKLVVWSCDPQKALGYDGFNLKFIREMWDTLGGEVTDFMKQFFMN